MYCQIGNSLDLSYWTTYKNLNGASFTWHLNEKDSSRDVNSVIDVRIPKSKLLGIIFGEKK